MTYRERAKEATWEAGAPQWGSDDRERLELAVEQAINAAVEEDRKSRPHQFVGSLDRWCEVCDEPDRDERHIPSRETLRNSVRLAVEEEREACAKICDAEADRQDKESGPAAYDVPARNCAVDIRARSTASDR